MQADKRPDDTFEWDVWTILVILLAVIVLLLLTAELWLPHYGPE
jgi:hypothetical protein